MRYFLSVFFSFFFFERKYEYSWKYSSFIFFLEKTFFFSFLLALKVETIFFFLLRCDIHNSFYIVASFSLANHSGAILHRYLK